MERLKDNSGAALIVTFIVLVSLTLIVLAFITMVSYEIRGAAAQSNDAKAFYLAEAGLARGRWALTTGGQTVGWGESDISLGDGTYTVTTTDNGDSTYTIVSDGSIPDDTNPIAQRRVQEKSVPVSTSGSGNLSLSATAAASSAKGANTADKANDGSSSSKWQANGTPSSSNPEWLSMDFGSTTTFDQVKFDEPAGNEITTYAIQYSSNGSSWTAVSNASESVSGSVTTVTFDSVSDRYHRIYITASTRRDPGIKEFESYDTSSGSLILGQGKFVTAW
jgi:Tfp pilus assembly protein PilX